MSNEEKFKISNNLPDWFNQVICGIMLSDGTLHYTTLHYTTLHYTTLHYTTLHYTTLRMNVNNALLGIQQTHEELTLQQSCEKYALI
jgi:hypothetical protein